MDILQYITAEENRYQTVPVPVVDGWEWSMAQHVKLTTLYLNSKYTHGKDLPFKNIILPKINLQKRAIRVKKQEIDAFVDAHKDYYKSFLVRKFHDKWVYDNNIIVGIDLATDTYEEYGGVLLKRVKGKWEVVPFQRLAFVDQTDMLSGPICEKHQFSPDQLLDMAGAGWGSKSNGANISLDEAVALSKQNKSSSQVFDGKGQIETPGNYVEVYELHGVLEESYLKEGGDPDKYVRQMQIVMPYKDQEGKKHGLVLFRSKESELQYDQIIRDPIFGRALGRGGVEELFEPQVWTNYAEIQKKELLDQASKVLYQTTDPTFSTRNQTVNAENGETFVLSSGTRIDPVNNTAPNVVAFENNIQSWDANAKEIAAAFDSISGADAKSGTPFRLGMLLNQEAHSLHKDRKQKFLNGLTQVYRKWMVPEFQKEILKEQEFLADLPLDELERISDEVITSLFNKEVAKKVLDGQIIAPGEQEELLEAYKQNFFKGGNKRFLKIFKDEMKDLPIDVRFAMGSEIDNKALMAEKLSAIWTQVVQILQVNPNFFNEHPEMAKLFNEIIESSGLSPVAFGLSKPRTAPQNAPQQAVNPQAGQMPQMPMQLNNQPQAV
jgi:hypothetical protein